jgi:hypothetical protein
MTDVTFLGTIKRILQKVRVLPEEKIEYGLETATTDWEIVRLYIILAFADAGTILTYANRSSGTHFCQKMSYLIETALNNIWNGTPNYTAYDASNPEGCFRILGELARLTLAGEDFAAIVNDAWFTATFGAALDEWFGQVWHFIYMEGEDPKILGMFSRIEKKNLDEAMAGILLAFAAVMFPITGHAMSFGDQLNRGVDYVGDFGRVKSFNREDPDSWDAAPFFLTDGSASERMLGLDPSYVNDPDILTTDIPVLKSAENIWQRLLSRSKWTWRYGRWIEAIPYYSLFLPNADGDHIKYDEWHDSSCNWRPWQNTGTNCNLGALIRQVRELYVRIKKYYYGTKSLGDAKQWFAMKYIRDFMIKPGTGGLLIHQCATHDPEVGEDILDIKWRQTSCTFDQEIRNDPEEDEYRIDLRGEVPIDDLVLLHTMSQDIIEGAAFNFYAPWVTVASYWGVPFEKYEYRGEIMGEQFTDLGPTNDPDSSSSVACFREWVLSGPANWLITDTMTRAQNWLRRALDPYKKLPQTLIDHRVFTLDNGRRVFLESIMSEGSANEASSGEIAIIEEQVASAIPADTIGETVLDEQTASAKGKEADYVDPKSGKEWFKRKGEDAEDFKKRSGQIKASAIIDEEKVIDEDKKDLTFKGEE